jgi:hypothetical protein
MALRAALLLTAGGRSSWAQLHDRQPSVEVTQFIAAEGVNTHINYTDGGYADTARIVQALRYLGIANVRDSLNTPGQSRNPPLETYQALARDGLRFTLMVGGGGPILASGGVPANPSLDQRVAYIDQVAAAVPHSIAAVEGTNEINNQPIIYQGLGGTGGSEQLQAALTMQRDLYALVKAAPHLKDVPVYYFTGYGTGSLPTGPDPTATPGLADADNQHPYPQRGEPPGFWVSRRQALNNLSNRDIDTAPAVYTETGYTSVGGVDGGVGEDVQMKYTLDLLLDDASSGIAATFLYELLDAYPPGSPQGDGKFGLFDDAGRPKPVAVAIHNLNTILLQAQRNAHVPPIAPLPYAIAGQSPTGTDLSLTAGGGEQVVALWDEQGIWDQARGVRVEPTVSSVTVSFGYGSVCHDIAVYDPTAGVQAVAVFKAACKATVLLSDHPILLVVSLAE